jgi:enterochelin esterase family protein
MRGLVLGLALVILGPSLIQGAFAAEPRKPGEYPPTIDSIAQPGVAKGKLIGPLEFRSKIIEGTVRRYWIYVPVGYNPKEPPNLLVFQDGQRAIGPILNIPTVLDNLIAKGDIPKTIGIFITPGNTGTEHYPDNLGQGNPNHRPQEYDQLNDAYGRMLIEEILPEVAKKYAFTSDPKKRAIGGTSSGAICAWTVAWNHPDAFGNVISYIGSYTSIGYHAPTAGQPAIYGGDTYPGLIRRSPPKPIRIFFQDGTADLDNQFGNWHLANLSMVAALQYANATADQKKDSGPRYDVKFEWGDGAHSDVHGAWLLPGVLRWMFGK